MVFYDIICIVNLVACAAVFLSALPDFFFNRWGIFMNLSDNGINLLKQCEGCVKNGNMHIIYDDQTGKPVKVSQPLPCGATIGYGHLIKANENFVAGLTEAQATDLLRMDIIFAESAVNKYINVPITQNQYDALVIFAFNIGVNNFANSTVVKYVNNPNFKSLKYPTLKSAWGAWNKSNGHEMPGLTSRRAKELELYYLHTAV